MMDRTVTVPDRGSRERLTAWLQGQVETKAAHRVSQSHNRNTNAEEERGKGIQIIQS